MILDTIHLASRYAALHPAFEQAFRFLAQGDLNTLAPGRYELDGVNLYANVAATALMAGELDEAEISSQIEPILSSALGAISLSVPGVQAASAIVISSILTGTANAFLTLRVGVISRSYCGALFLADRKKVRRSATAESAKMLGSIVKSGTARISKSLWHASMGKVGGAFSGLTGIARDIKDSLFTLLKKVGENSKNTETDLH